MSSLFWRLIRQLRGWVSPSWSCQTPVDRMKLSSKLTCHSWDALTNSHQYFISFFFGCHAVRNHSLWLINKCFGCAKKLLRPDTSIRAATVSQWMTNTINTTSPATIWTMNYWFELLSCSRNMMKRCKSEKFFGAQWVTEYLWFWTLWVSNAAVLQSQWHHRYLHKVLGGVGDPRNRTNTHLKGESGRVVSSN